MLLIALSKYGASRGNRTLNPLQEAVWKTAAFTCFATGAPCNYELTIFLKTSRYILAAFIFCTLIMLLHRPTSI